MPDNTRIRQPEDPTKINVNQQWELEYWSKELGINVETLKAAVKICGPMVKDVRKCLGK